jgi:hypothetical protein
LMATASCSKVMASPTLPDLYNRPARFVSTMSRYFLGALASACL